jgi:hypothetical protein
MARQPSATANWTRAPSSTRRPGECLGHRRPDAEEQEVAAVQPRQTDRGAAVDQACRREGPGAGQDETHPAGGGVRGHPHQILEGTRSGSVRAGAQRDVVDEEQKVVIRSGITLETPHEFHQAAQSPDLVRHDHRTDGRERIEG